MKINAIKCKKCGYIIFSRNRHEMRDCMCGSCSIDGGFDYTKISGNYKDIIMCLIDIKVSKKQLQEDYMLKTDKYGIHTEEEIKEMLNEDI